MIRIDGKAHSAALRAELKQKISAYERKIGLAVVLVGDDPASCVYVRNKTKGCEEVGIRSYSYTLPKETTQAQLLSLVDELNQDDRIDGILVQLPLPDGIDEEAILAHIAPEKDVDGFSAVNLGLLAKNTPATVACTPAGVMKLLEREGIDPKGKRAVVLGRSSIVGKPMAMLLLNADATVTVCHSKTVGLKEICKQADILVAAIGKAKFVGSDMVKDGAVVIDVGINRDENGKLCGDVDEAAVADKVSYLTPVPGGVGPMTITMLLWNTYYCSVRRDQ